MAKTKKTDVVEQPTFTSSKPVSHFERLCIPTVESNFKSDRTMYKLQYTKELDAKTNRVARKAKKVIKDRYEEMKNFRVSDFSLENLQAIGAELNPTMLSRSNINTIQEIESAINYSQNTNE